MPHLTLSRLINPFMGALFALLFVSGCQSPTEPQAPGYAYFPLETDQYRDYAVTEQQFSLNGTATTETYQLREVMTDSYENSAHQPAFRIKRYRRTSDTEAWQPDSVSSAVLINDQLVKTENNLSYVKLIFPVSERAQWNGNAFNALGKDEYQFRNTGQPFTVLNQTFPVTATVLQQNDSTLVNQDKRLEIYAQNLGLIYRETIRLQFCSATPSCVGTGKIDYGFRQYLRLKAYGKL